MDALTYDDRSQAVILNSGVPILSKVNNEDIGVFNNQRFKIRTYDKLYIYIIDQFNKELKIDIQDFQKYFLVAYATTCHKAQGMTFNEPYTMHEWDRMDQRLKYVACSRSTEHSYIHIMK